ncbi:PKSKA1 [Xylaria digitata]|nr:PKSKA1 [Xylaria digitata]
MAVNILADCERLPDSDVTSQTSEDHASSSFSGGFGQVSSQHSRNRSQVPIAVVGMGCRLPGHSNSPTGLWSFLNKGGVAINEPPSSRFSLAGHYDSSGKPRTMKSPGGMFLEDVDPAVFDGQFFQCSRADCIAMDPQQRQLLEVTYECLENAGVTLEKVSGTKTGVIVGTNFIDYAAIQNRDPEDRADSITVGLASSILSNRISHFLNANGPSMTLDTACSASLVAVDVACRYLDSFQADAMLVGGANMWLSPEHNEEIGMMHMTQSATGRCHSFDAKADGYVKAEGINAVYLKRLDDAIRDGNAIRAVIRGTAVGASGRTAGIANPSPDMQALTIRAAYKNAGITDFRATTFLECHGTGTLAGDPVEVKGASSVFAQGRELGQELIIGSIKSNIGHSEAAAGLSGLIKAILAVESGVIPGTPTFITPNPNIDWAGSKVKASRTSIKWPSSSVIRRASVNSFGFGGANAHVVLDQAPVTRHVSSYKQVTTNFFDDSDDEDDSFVTEKASKSLSSTLLVFSANDASSLKSNVKALSAHLINPTVSVDLRDLAFTLSETRSRHYYRAFTIVTSSKHEIKEETLTLGKQAVSPPKIGFVFTGQGAQWSQMGRDLVNTFPLAEKMIRELDGVLQSLPDPPSWSLLSELTEARTTEVLRQPEFSQPLVTALQLGILEVLKSWGIQPRAVVGHSSGEIAAAAAAGLITPQDAIKVAYFRGQAAKNVGPAAAAVGMLAVGIGPKEVEKYLTPFESEVQIACFNSPSSLTLSGTRSALNEICDCIKKDGHFARMLLVDLAYHSSFMAKIGEVYEKLLLDAKILHEPSGKLPGACMFSSVTGKPFLPTEQPDVAYWKKNMVSAVQFSRAASELLQNTEAGADFLIEVGPSNALSGPIAQVKQAIQRGAGANAQYTSTLKRGPDSILAMYDMAGKLFLAGGAVNLAKVNRLDQESVKMRPNIIVDLPNYSWNHTSRYWHETEASKDWRFKKFINHDLLGSKTLGSSWQSPVFKKVLKLSESPWLRDHKLGAQVVFPGAAYMTMAVEAIYQCAMVTQWKEVAPARYRYRLRDVKFNRALVLEENSETRVTLALTPLKGGSIRNWYQFRVCSAQETLEHEHCTGMVCVETDYRDTKAPKEAIKPLEFPVPATVWYKALGDVGYKFGPCFQKHLRVETTVGKRVNRSVVNLEAPPSNLYSQSNYPMHPAVMDACLQTGSPSLWMGDPSSANMVLVPKVIDSLVVSGGRKLPTEGITNSSATFLGVGNRDIVRNHATNVALYDPQDGALLFEMRGLASAEIEASEDDSSSHSFSRLSWNADADMLMASEPDLVRKWFVSKGSNHKTIQDVINVVAHKQPRLKVLELNLDPEDASSIWLQDDHSTVLIRAASSQYHLAARTAKSMIDAQQQLSTRAPSTIFSLLALSDPAEIGSGGKFDLAIVKKRLGILSPEEEDFIRQTLNLAIRPGGFIVAAGLDDDVLTSLGKAVTFPLTSGKVTLCRCQSTRNDNAASRLPIKHVQLLDTESEHSTAVDEILGKVSKYGWAIQKQSVIIMDEIFKSVMDNMTETQWEIIKKITQQRSRLLWVTSGGHLDVTDPTRASITGLLRTIRAEEQTPLMTLDVENRGGKTTVAAIVRCLEQLSLIEPDTTESQPVDYEFVERGGIVYTSRLLNDAKLTGLQSDELSARKTETVNIRDRKTTVQLRCERLGNLDAIHFHETAPEPAVLTDGLLEVEILTAGLNYKDVVVSMGIVPGDETALGHEAAGIVTKVTPGVATAGYDFKIGQRVVVFGKGTFANRIQTTPGRVHRIPNSMTFEEAATISVVYLTSIRALCDVAKLTAGQRILIHSAAGGVGIAAIQLAKYIGAEVFATVGTDEKREFLKVAFGLDDGHIFYSRNTDFADECLAATAGQGVDVILNSLTGDMLDEGFRILADGGVMVEIGKKDILDRNNLPMAPFDRNVSFRAVDMSPEKVSDALSSRLFSELFELIENGHIKPINPIHTFSWAEIPSAIRFLRGGNHIGKIVLSDNSSDNIQVPVRRAPKTLHFRDNGAYLIVGGLRGLCGSLAIYLAKSGCKNLAVISRSGHEDDKSRGIVRQVSALGAHIDLLRADITVAAEVEAAFKRTSVPVVGIIQGAMVLRDRPFESMSVTEYHEAIQCKIQGTWNLHNAAENLGLHLDFFTMLSSISGVIGNHGQANYSAANVFLDSFADWRRQRGQAACSVNLGVIEDAGFIAENAGFQDQHFDPRFFKGINDGTLRKILYLSILQQQEQDAYQIVTGLVAPQPVDSPLRRDARFAALFAGESGSDRVTGAVNDGDSEVQGLLMLLKTPSADVASKTLATVDVVNKCLMRLLQLSELMDPARPFSVYGIDSLSAVEVRNWVRGKLGALVTTLDIMNASSLASFCEKIVMKIASSGK